MATARKIIKHIMWNYKSAKADLNEALKQLKLIRKKEILLIKAMEERKKSEIKEIEGEIKYIFIELNRCLNRALKFVLEEFREVESA